MHLRADDDRHVTVSVYLIAIQQDRISGLKYNGPASADFYQH
jgi:hypothetical protein